MWAGVTGLHLLRAADTLFDALPCHPLQHNVKFEGGDCEGARALLDPPLTETGKQQARVGLPWNSLRALIRAHSINTYLLKSLRELAIKSAAWCTPCTQHKHVCMCSCVMRDA